MPYLAPRYFAPRYFAPRYFGPTQQAAPVRPGLLPGKLLHFARPPRAFSHVAVGGLAFGGAATTCRTFAQTSGMGLALGGAAQVPRPFDRWARARAEDEVWLLLL